MDPLGPPHHAAPCRIRDSGRVTLARNWRGRDDLELPRAPRQTLSAVHAGRTIQFVAAMTMTAGVILANCRHAHGGQLTRFWSEIAGFLQPRAYDGLLPRVVLWISAQQIPFSANRRLNLQDRKDSGVGGYMPPCYRYGRTLTRIALSFWALTILSFAQNTSAGASPGPPKHFDHVLIVVLENQDYDSAMKVIS